MEFKIVGHSNSSDETTYFVEGLEKYLGSFFATLQSTALGVQKDDSGRYIIEDTDFGGSDYEVLFDFIGSNRKDRERHQKYQKYQKYKDCAKYNEEVTHIVSIMDTLLDKYQVDMHYAKSGARRLWIIIKENWIRYNMYQPAYAYHTMNTDPSFNLIKLRCQKDLERIISNPGGPIKRPEQETNVLFEHLVPAPKVQNWDNIKQRLGLITELSKIPGVFIAGGFIFSALYGTHLPDVDVFLCREKGCLYKTDEEAEHKIYEIIKSVREKFSHVNAEQLSFTRTKYAVTILIDSIDKSIPVEIQVILRIYNSPSEVLHGFDVDCCCLGYRNGEIWVTPRAVSALQCGYNTVDFDRLSPSYEYRLAKYAARGMAIRVPEFRRASVNTVLLRCYITEGNWCKKTNLDARMRHPHRAMQGLNLLLFLEAYYESTKHKQKLGQTFIKLAHEKSDYGPIPFNYATPGAAGTKLFDNIDYMLLDSTKQRYPDHYEKYVIHFRNYIIQQLRYQGQDFDATLPSDEWIESFEWFRGEFRHVIINNPLSKVNYQKKIFFAKVFDTQNLSKILHINEHIYAGMATVANWEFPAHVTFRRIAPGEQTTSSFHKIVLDNPRTWYMGIFYEV